MLKFYGMKKIQIIQYFVDEIKLNFDEERIYRDLYTFVEQSLDSLETTKEKKFDAHLNDVIKKHEGFFISNPCSKYGEGQIFSKKRHYGLWRNRCLNA